MKWSPYNQINASVIDISRIKWLVFLLLWLSFFRTTSKYRWQALKQRPIIDPHPVEQTAYRRDIKDNGYKSVFTNSWLVRQRNRSWIKGLGKNPQKSELIHWRQCLLSGAIELYPLRLRETLACIRIILYNVTATCGVLTRLPAKLAKNGMHAKTSADWRVKTNCWFKRHPMRTG